MIFSTGLYTSSHFDGNGAPIRWGITFQDVFMQHAHRFGADHPFLAGAMLIPQGTITNPARWTGFGFGADGVGGVGGRGVGGGTGSGGAAGY